MATYFRICPRIWYEPWDTDMRYLALYLLTNDRRETEGLYRITKRAMLADLQWSANRFSRAWDALLEAGFMDYDDEANVVFIRNALKYQQPENPNQRKHAVAVVEQLPQTHLFNDLLYAAERYSKPLAKVLVEAFPNGSGTLAEPLANRSETVTETVAKPPAPAPTPEEHASEEPFGFADFYKVYPRKQGKAAAVRAFEKLTMQARDLATTAARRMGQQQKRSGYDLKFIPYPATWLNQRRWEEWQDGKVPPGWEASSDGEPDFIHPMDANSIASLGYDPFEKTGEDDA